MLSYTDTPIQEIFHPSLEKAGIRLLIKREDLNHPFIAGNKWWKLKYNLAEAIRLQHDTILTFGGTYSNHIYATAAAAKEVNLKSIGIIRGEKILPLNTTLSFAEDQGMTLHYVSREDYRKKNSIAFSEDLHSLFGNFYLIPEGGTNQLAVKGCAEFAQTELKNIEFNYLCLPVGTGGTISGIICGLEGQKQIIGISVLKDGAFLKKEIENLVKNFSHQSYGNWSLLTSYHHGGYAKVSDELVKFIVGFKRQHKIPLDPVYTGKLMWAIVKEVEQGFFKRGSTVLALHTGGLQGADTILSRYEKNFT